MPDAPRLLVFDLSRHVHLPGYLRFLIEGWRRREAGTLELVVWRTFLDEHADVVALAERDPRRSVRFRTLTEDEQRHKLRHERAALDEVRSRRKVTYRDALREGAVAEALSYDWAMLRRYADLTGATRALIVHLDSYMPLLACGVEPPCPLSGIFFGPTFHYGDFEGPPPDEKQRATALHQKFLLARVLASPRVHRLFLLDPLAVDATRGFPGREKIEFLPDPVPASLATEADVTALRERLGVAADRTVLLMFGHLTPRKGCGRLLDALERLPVAACGEICLVLAGPIQSRYRRELEARLSALEVRRPLQIVRRFGFVPHEEVSTWFRMADVVLAPYPRHAGMSGIVLLAAAAGRPVLGPAYGLVGALVRRHRLGLAVEAHDPHAIAAGLERLLAGPPRASADHESMRRLAARHAPERFASTLLAALCS